MVTRGPGMAACSSSSMARAAARASAHTEFGQSSICAAAALPQRGPCLVQITAPAPPASSKWTDGPAPSN
eukprot:8483956-Alexandrium_andersonii.AAC.1